MPRDIKSELKRYKKRSQILSIVCNKHSGYYKRLNNSFTVVLIFFSGFVSIINSLEQTLNINTQVVKLFNICLNAIITVLVTLQRVFKYEAKSNDFNKASGMFAKMSHSIEQKLLTEEYDINFVESTITIYDTTLEHLDGFKDVIIKKLKKEFSDVDADYLPLCFETISLEGASSDSPVRGIGRQLSDRRERGPILTNSSSWRQVSDRTNQDSPPLNINMRSEIVHPSRANT
jgi:hypothetical protein